jgi:hypothetical protein
VEPLTEDILAAASLNKKSTFSRSVFFLPPCGIRETGLPRVSRHLAGRPTTVSLYPMLYGQLKTHFAFGNTATGPTGSLSRRASSSRELVFTLLPCCRRPDYRLSIREYTILSTFLESLVSEPVPYQQESSFQQRAISYRSSPWHRKHANSKIQVQVSQRLCFRVWGFCFFLLRVHVRFATQEQLESTRWKPSRFLRKANWSSQCLQRNSSHGGKELFM